MNTLYSCLITENYVFIWYKLKWSANYSFAVYLRFNLDYIVFYLINLDRQLVKQSNFRLTSVFESENGKKNSWDFRYADYSVLHRLQCLSRAGTTWSLSTASMKHNHGNYSHTILVQLTHCFVQKSDVVILWHFFATNTAHQVERNGLRFLLGK